MADLITLSAKLANLISAAGDHECDDSVLFRMVLEIDGEFKSVPGVNVLCGCLPSLDREAVKAKAVEILDDIQPRQR